MAYSRDEIKQITDHNLRTLVAQRLRAFVFSSHHRTHRFALLQQQLGDRAPYGADAARGAGNQNGSCHVFPSSESKVGLWNAGVNQQNHYSLRRALMMFREADYVPRPHRFPYGSSYTRLFLNGLSHERRGRLACLDDIS